MRPGSFYALLTIAIVIGAVAVYAVRTEDGAFDQRDAGKLLFPEFAAQINDAAAIRIEGRNADGTTRLLDITRDGDTWRVAEKGGYAARFDRVKTTLVGLARLRAVERRTSRPDLYSRLQVGDPAKEGAKSSLLTVKDAAGKTLVALIVGKPRSDAPTQGRQMLYVRRPGEAVSWLAEGEFTLETDAFAWLEKKVVNVTRRRVREVKIAHSGSDPLVIAKVRPDDENFQPRDLPKGREIKSAYSVNVLGRALESLDMEEVEPAAKIAFAADKNIVAEIHTFGGVLYRVVLVKAGDKYWARFAAAYETPPPIPAPEKAPDAESGDAKAKKIADEDIIRDAKAAKAEIAEFNRRHDGWAYQLNRFKAEILTKKKDDILLEKKDDKPS